MTVENILKDCVTPYSASYRVSYALSERTACESICQSNESLLEWKQDGYDFQEWSEIDDNIELGGVFIFGKKIIISSNRTRKKSVQSSVDVFCSDVILNNLHFKNSLIIRRSRVIIRNCTIAGGLSIDDVSTVVLVNCSITGLSMCKYEGNDGFVGRTAVSIMGGSQVKILNSRILHSFKESSSTAQPMTLILTRDASLYVESSEINSRKDYVAGVLGVNSHIELKETVLYGSKTGSISVENCSFIMRGGSIKTLGKGMEDVLQVLSYNSKVVMDGVSVIGGKKKIGVYGCCSTIILERSKIARCGTTGVFANDNSVLHLNNVVFQENGYLNSRTPQLEIENSIAVINNVKIYDNPIGFGIYASKSRVLISNSRITNNGGGGVYLQNGSCEISGSDICFNGNEGSLTAQVVAEKAVLRLRETLLSDGIGSCGLLAVKSQVGIYNSKICKNSKEGIFADKNCFILVEDSDIYENAVGDIGLSQIRAFCSEIVLKGVVVRDGIGAAGIVVADCSEINIINSEVTGHRGIGVVISKKSRGVIDYSDIYNNGGKLTDSTGVVAQVLIENSRVGLRETLVCNSRGCPGIASENSFLVLERVRIYNNEGFGIVTLGKGTLSVNDSKIYANTVRAGQITMFELASCLLPVYGQIFTVCPKKIAIVNTMVYDSNTPGIVILGRKSVKLHNVKTWNNYRGCVCSSDVYETVFKNCCFDDGVLRIRS